MLRSGFSLELLGQTVLFFIIIIVQSLSHVQLCNSMNCSMPGFPVLHYLLEFAQIHVH